MNAKWQYTTEIFDAYERRFALARAEKPLTRPWEPEHRAQIIASAKRMLRYEEALIPRIHDMQEISRQEYVGYTGIQYRFQSWERVYGAATLYLPEKEGRLPLVFVCCGHGKQGRLTDSYMAMGHRLASLGMAALVMDNIGQGDRNLTPDAAHGIDHWLAVAPFRCGLTMQGLIVMETLALIRYMKEDPRFDPERFAACGNSGGGTLTMFLAALAPELSAVASCGYPSEAAYLLQKEKSHCACNLLVGQACEAEMWELYSVFAPKPLLLEGGREDNLIPMDLAHRNARKVKNTYMQLDAAENFHFTLTKTKHSWELEDLNLISGFLSRQLLGITPEDADAMYRQADLTPLQVTIPEDRLTTAQLSQALTGIQAPEADRLEDVFFPTFRGAPVDPEQLEPNVCRNDPMRVFAQLECALIQRERGESNGKED